MLELKQFIMLGTLHYDPKGSERVVKLLERFQPTIVTVEANKDQLQWEKTGKLPIVRETKRMFAKKGLTPEESDAYDRWEEQIFHYEWRTSESYCREKQIPLFLIDLFDGQEKVAWGKSLTRFAREERPDGMRYQMNPDKISGNQEVVDDEYHAVYMSYTFYGVTNPWNDPDVGRRDVYMENRIREILGQYPGARLVHVGGTKHIFDDPWQRTLFSRLKDLNPEKHLLIEADEQPSQNSSA